MRARALCVVALALGLLACQPAATPPATKPAAAGSAGGGPQASAAPGAAAQRAPAQGAPAAPPTTVRVAQVYVASALVPFWLAIEEGYFREQGIQAEAVLLRGSVEGMAALAGGDVHVMLTAPSPATMGAAVQDPDLVILGTTNNRLQYQFVASVPTFAELRGKRVAISRPGDSSHYLALQTLERFGLREGDVDFVNVGPIPERTAALLTGQVDATLVIIPSNLQVMKAGLYQLTELGELGIPYIGTSLYARKSWAEPNRAVVEGFLKALIRGNQAVVEQPERAKAALKKYLSIEDTEELEATYQDNVRGTEPALQPSMAGIEDVIKQTAAANPGAAGLRPEQLVDLRYVQAIEASGFIKK